MQQSDVIYQVGEQDGENLPHAFVFHFGKAGMTRTNASGVTRYMEFWCQENCRGKWQIVETENTARVAFDRGLDVVVFQLSDEYSRFARSEGILERPHHVE